MNQGLSLSLILVALCSGLAGAIITLAGGYFVQKRLADRERRMKINQWCFSQIIMFSKVIAAFSATKTLFEIFAERHLEEFSSSLSNDQDEFDISHALCVKLAEGIKKYVEEHPDSIKKAKPTSKLLRTILEKSLDLKIESEILVYLSHDALIEWSVLNEYLRALLTPTAIWIEFIESSNADLLDAYELHRQWRIINKCIKSATKLVHILIREGGISRSRVNKIYSRQYSIWSEDYILAGLEDHIKIPKVPEYFTKQDTKTLVE